MQTKVDRVIHSSSLFVHVNTRLKEPPNDHSSRNASDSIRMYEAMPLPIKGDDFIMTNRSP
jgi:hypothetical protein